MIKVVGIDLSLTRTGWAVAHVEDGRTTVSTGLVRPGDLRGPERLVEIANRLRDVCQDAVMVAMEGYAYSAGGKGGSIGRAFDLGEVGGVVKTALWTRRHKVAIIPPTTLKRYATGKGNAPKALVLVDAVKRLGYEGSDDNEADALFLCQMILDHLGVPLVRMPAINRESLNAVEWPHVELPLPDDQDHGE